MRSLSILLCVLFLCGMARAFALETRILYVRHAEVPGNDPNPLKCIYTGCRTDQSLTDTGQVQAVLCAEKIIRLEKEGVLGQIAAIYASPLKRALETAVPIASLLGLDIQQRQDLREIDWGNADGELVQKMNEKYREREEQINGAFPERKKRWDHLPVFAGAETYNHLLQRTFKELRMIADSHPEQAVVIIGHGRVLKTLLTDMLDAQTVPAIFNCCIAEFTYSPAKGLHFIKVL